MKPWSVQVQVNHSFYNTARSPDQSGLLDAEASFREKGNVLDHLAENSRSRPSGMAESRCLNETHRHLFFSFSFLCDGFILKKFL